MQMSAAAPQGGDRIWCKEREAGCLGAYFRLVFAWPKSRKFIGRTQHIRTSECAKVARILVGSQVHRFSKCQQKTASTEMLAVWVRSPTSLLLRGRTQPRRRNPHTAFVVVVELHFVIRLCARYWLLALR